MPRKAKPDHKGIPGALPPKAMASKSSKRKDSDKPSKQDNKKAKPDHKGIPGALPPKAVITTKARTIKDKIIYEGFPKALIDAGYNQSLIASIKKKSIIKNQAEFNEKVSDLNDHIGALINLVKPEENSRIGFNAENITSILRGSGPNVGKAIANLALKIDSLKPIRDLDFTPANISSILSESGQNVGLAIDALTSNERVNKLKKLLAPVEEGGAGFTTSNISSILRGSGQNAGEAIDALTNGYEALKKLLAPVEEGGAGFTPANISSILCGSRQKLGDAIDALTKGSDALKKLLTPVEDGGAGFTPANISSILCGSGQNVGEAIEALAKGADNLKTLVDLGFTPANISSILNGSGQNVGKAIDALTQKVVKLQKLLAPVEEGGAGFTTSNISSILRGSGQKFGDAIDALEIINVTNQGRSSPISTKILTNFLSNLKKTKLIKIYASNVESILSELEKTKLRDPSPQVPSAGAPSSNDPSSQLPSAGAPSYFQTHNPFECEADPYNEDAIAELSAGLGIDGPSTPSGEDPSSSKSQQEQSPREGTAPSRGSKRPPGENLAGKSAKKR